MSWTDSDTIKLHLQALSVNALKVAFQPLRIEDGKPVQLPHAALLKEEVLLFAEESKPPTGPVDVTLTGDGWISLGLGPLYPGSVVLAKGWLLDGRFLEGVDFAVDEKLGQVKRLSGGGIGTGIALKAWCLPMTQFTEGVDYVVDYTVGTITPLPGGGIPDPARLLISYTTTAAGVSDELIGQTIAEVEAKILDRLKDEHTASSTDVGLKIGAMELTLSHLCDDMALRSLTIVGDASADDRARRFLDLSQRYEERAINTLSKFLRTPLPSVSTRQSNIPASSGW